MPNDITLDSEVLERNFKSKLHQVLVNHMVINAKPPETNKTVMSSKELVRFSAAPSVDLEDSSHNKESK